MARAKGFNIKAVDLFFNILYEKVRNKHKDVNRILNIKVSRFFTVQKKNSKIVGQKREV